MSRRSSPAAGRAGWALRREVVAARQSPLSFAKDVQMPNTELVTNAPQLPAAVARRGLDEPTWRSLKNAVYPGASSEAILMAVDYCLANRLDPLRKPVHLVPMEVKIAGTDRSEWRDVPMLGIYALRTIALRSGAYLGHSRPEFGPLIKVDGLHEPVPEYVEMEFRRLHPSGEKITFPIRTYFREVVATKRDGKPNGRWARAPVQMLVKCCEAAGLRETCPDETGGLPTVDEMEGQRSTWAAPAIDAESAPVPELPKPADYDQWLTDLIAVADNGLEAFAEAWKAAGLECRSYLMATEPDGYEQLKQKAANVGTTPSDED